MCSVDAPEPIEIEKPTFVRNPFLDETREDVAGADALRRGRSSLVIPSATGIGFSGRGGSSGVGGLGIANNNGRRSRTNVRSGNASAGGSRNNGIPTGGPRGPGGQNRGPRHR